MDVKRAAFEKAMIERRGYAQKDFTCSAAGIYLDRRVKDCWAIWQAAIEQENQYPVIRNRTLEEARQKCLTLGLKSDKQYTPVDCAEAIEQLKFS